ncbi:complement C1q subcomponent subunit A-like [Ascaphus truei]|uniref:complement C1q subcomponent subunit A-like n=1 Tax=Ascaphus truei TaxID=8439 RepID=UPI003F59BF79
MARNVWLPTLLLAVVLGMVESQSDVCEAPHGKDGQAGIAGRDGRPGQKGDRGQPGLSGSKTGLVATKGDEGDRGPTGEPGQIGYKGPQGPPGPPGEQGPRGSKGAMANIADQRRPAFSAINPKLSSNMLVFTNTITNQENPYNIDTGKFTCKEPGYYYFTFQVVSSGDLCLYIVAKRGTKMEKLLGFCDNNSRNQPQVNSGGSVLNLKNSDEVWIETNAQSRKIASTSESSSIFSGFLLFPHQE